MSYLNSRLKILALAFVLMPTYVMAQSDSESGANGFSDPWEDLSLNSKTKLKLSFRNANVDNVIAMIEQASGITIVKDPMLVGSITVTTSKPVSLPQAFYVLNEGLKLRGFEIRRQRSILVIKAIPKPPTRNGLPNNMNQGIGGPGASALVKFYPLQFASAIQVARAINDVFQTTGANVGRIFGTGGGPGRLFQGGPGGGANGGQGMSGDVGSSGIQQPPGTGVVRASYEEFSNSVIVNAPASMQSQVAELIKDIDKQQTQALHSKTYTPSYANASELAAVIQNVLVANSSKGRGTPTSSATQQGFTAFSPFGGFGATSATQNSTVAVADSRTNSLIVTGTDDLLKIADKIVNDLDRKMPFTTTTFVYQLQNARSDTVANLLTAAFGQRQGAGSSRTTSITPTNNTFSSSSSKTTGPTAGANIDGSQNLALNMQDPNAQSGDLMTSVGVTQGFSGGLQVGGQGQG
jgi:general secretion pathway protein D